MTTDDPDAYVGKAVKRRFPVTSHPDDPAGGRVAGEHMWVDVIAVEAGYLVGVLQNFPQFDVGYQFGDLVRFPASEIEMVDDGPADATRVLH